MVSNQVTNLFVSTTTQEHKAIFPFPESYDSEQRRLGQHITQLVDGQLMTELLMRQGEGSLLTTEREWKKIEQDNIKAEAMIEQFVRSCIKLEGEGRLKKK